MDDEQLRAIGRVVVNQEHLQSSLQFWIWEWGARTQRYGQIMTTGTPYGQTIRVFRGLLVECFGEQFPDDVEAIKAELKVAQRLEERRNELTHSTWAAGGTRIKSRNRQSGIQFTFERLTPDDINEVADEFNGCINRTRTLVFDLLMKA